MVQKGGFADPPFHKFGKSKKRLKDPGRGILRIYHPFKMPRPPREANFPTMLRELRAQSKFSLRALAERSKVPHSYISNIENGRRPVGQKVAGVLADVFGLKGKKREQFLLAAAQDSPRDKILRCVGQFPAKILNAFALKVRHELASALDGNQDSDKRRNRVPVMMADDPLADEFQDALGKPTPIARCHVNFPSESLPFAVREIVEGGHPRRPRVIDLAIELTNGQWLIWDFIVRRA